MNDVAKNEDRLKRINAKLAHLRGIIAGFSSPMDQGESVSDDTLDAVDELLDAASQLNFLINGELK